MIVTSLYLKNNFGNESLDQGLTYTIEEAKAWAKARVSFDEFNEQIVGKKIVNCSTPTATGYLVFGEVK